MTAMYATCFIQYHCFWKQLEYTLLATCLFYFHLSVNIFNLTPLQNMIIQTRYY